MAGLRAPLPTLRQPPREGRRTLGAGVGRYSFTVMDLHHLLLAGSRRTLKVGVL